MDDRIPVHLEVSGLVRAIQSEGGFGMVLAKGEPDAGTLMIICCENGTKLRAYERMPQLDGSRAWMLSKEQNAENPMEFSDFVERRKRQDSDLWILELDGVNPERFIGLPPLTN